MQPYQTTKQGKLSLKLRKLRLFFSLDRLKNNLKSRLFGTKKIHQNYGSATTRTEATQTNF